MKYDEITIGMKVSVKEDKLLSRNQKSFTGIVISKYIAKTTNFKEKKADKITNQKTKYVMVQLVRVRENTSNIEYDINASRIDIIKSK